jgi:hypothetical protein
MRRNASTVVVLAAPAPAGFEAEALKVLAAWRTFYPGQLAAASPG